MLLRRVPVVSLAVWALGFATAACADEIHCLDGRVMDNCTVVDETYEAVRYRIGTITQPQTIPTAEVDYVVHTSPPDRYRSAKQALDAGDYQTAATRFETAARVEQEPWVRQYSLFYLGEARRLAGLYDQAQQAFRQLETDFARSIFLPQARNSVGLILLAQRNYTGAQQAFDTLRTEAQQRQYGERWILEARLGRADVLMAQGQAGPAQQEYAALARDARRSAPGVARQAQIRSFQAQVTAGQFQDAARAIEEFVGDETLAPEVAAPAYSILGDAYRQMNQHRDALKAYLRVVLLYGQVISEQPKALFYAAQEYRATDLPDRDRHAQQLMNELQGRFPTSEFAQRR